MLHLAFTAAARRRYAHTLQVFRGRRKNPLLSLRFLRAGGGKVGAKGGLGRF
jgi:hypothetical protein